MGSGRSNIELTYSGKKPREKKRRIKNQSKRLLALGVPENVVRKSNAKEIRQMLLRPLMTQKRWMAKKV